jgi:hypothetical protein
MGLNLFKLAELQLKKEGKDLTEALILAYAVKIRKWLDIHREKTAIKILAGGKVYQYGSRLIVR